MEEKTINVQILNKPSGIGEKIARLASHKSAALLRSATLSISDEKIEIKYSDDLANSIHIGSILHNSLRKIRIKKSAITLGNQLIKPAVNGALAGVVASLIVFRQDGFLRGTIDNVLLSIVIILLFAAAFVVLNLSSVSRSRLAVVSLESADWKLLEIAIDDKRADSLIALLAQNRVPVELIPDIENELQNQLDLLLRKGIFWSFCFWIAGIGSLIAIILARKAQKLESQANTKVKGQWRVWWCFGFGGFGIILWIALILRILANSHK